MSTNITAGRTMNDNKVKNLVITAFFTAITFLGIQSFRIPLPAAVGTPFLHFGHITNNARMLRLMQTKLIRWWLLMSPLYFF